MPPTPPWNRTKIVVTLGPTSRAPKTISRLMDKGVDVFRLNLSHGKLTEHSDFIRNIRRIAKKKHLPVAILGDLPGPKYRIGPLPEPLTIQKDKLLILTSKQSKEGQGAVRQLSLRGGSEASDEAIRPKGPSRVKRGISSYYNEIPHFVRNDPSGQIASLTSFARNDDYRTAPQLQIPHPRLIRKLNRGSILYLKDGSIKLKVVSKKKNQLLCRVITGGQVTSRAGINVPGLPNLLKTVDNRKYLEFVTKHKLDMAAVSFVEDAGDIIRVRKKTNNRIFIIAKIERSQALQNIDRIIEVSDGIMVARGDLGVELPLERVAIEQKEIVHKCNQAGKPVIIATQMLESMLNHTRPTRAEVSDVSNAILDGTDSVMLSSETAIGKYPIETVEFLVKIARVVEPERKELLSDRVPKTLSIANSISWAACNLAKYLQAKAIITPTRTGATARLVSSYRPNTMIITPTIDPLVQRQLMFSWGVYPILVKEIHPFRKLLWFILKETRKMGLLNKGDLIVVTGGTPGSPLGTTNLVEVHRV